MTRKQIDSIAAEFQMRERAASPFGNPHYVHDAEGAELELIVSGSVLHTSLLFEAESMSHLNHCNGKPIEDWTEEEVRSELRRLSTRRSRHEDESTVELELESAA